MQKLISEKIEHPKITISQMFNHKRERSKKIGA